MYVAPSAAAMEQTDVSFVPGVDSENAEDLAWCRDGIELGVIGESCERVWMRAALWMRAELWMRVATRYYSTWSSTVRCPLRMAVRFCVIRNEEVRHVGGRPANRTFALPPHTRFPPRAMLPPCFQS